MRNTLSGVVQRLLEHAEAMSKDLVSQMVLIRAAADLDKCRWGFDVRR